MLHSMMPTVFVSHGAPTLALDPGDTGPALGRISAGLPKPESILLVSAHWDTPQPEVSGALKPPTIHDFYGFPEPLYQLTYPAPGAPQLAKRVSELLAAQWSARIDPARGFDHGAWVPLRYLYPGADVPVTQLSVQAHLDAAHHFRLGQALQKLTAEGVLVLASGGFTHNLSEVIRVLRRGEIVAPLDYVESFRAWFLARLQDRDWDSLLRYRSLAPHAERAHPTDEHLLPLFVALGAAGERASTAHAHRATEYGSLALDAFVFS